MNDPLLNELHDDLLTWVENRPRSQQVELGASQVYSCRAACLCQLTGAPKTDARIGWESLAGIERHETIERARAHREVVSEKAFRYRGHKATIDEIRDNTVIDWKNPSPEKVRKLKSGAPPDKGYVAQVHLGAAAAIEAGYDITEVAIVFLPRGEDVRDGYVWRAPFDRAQADAAADWLDEQIARAQALGRVAEPSDLDGLRDRPALSFCRNWCEYFSLCRGHEAMPKPTDDPGIVEAARTYVAAHHAMKEAEAVKRAAQQELAGIPAVTVDGYALRWQGGTATERDELDIDELRAWWEMTQPDRPLPTRVVPTVTPLSLPVRKAKP